MNYDELVVLSREEVIALIADLEELIVFRYEKYCRGYWGGFGELGFKSWEQEHALVTRNTIKRLEGRMMKTDGTRTDVRTVFLCYSHYYDFCNITDTMMKVVDDEKKAMEWVASVTPTKFGWNSYLEVEVE